MQKREDRRPNQHTPLAYNINITQADSSPYAFTMMAPHYYVFTGGGERVPWHVTHVLIDKALNYVPAQAFEGLPNIEEVICHDGVEKVEPWAFYKCPSLRRVIMPGVKVIERNVFDECEALTYIECGKLERIGQQAFGRCKSLSSIYFPSVKIVNNYAFTSCKNLVNAKFGKGLETIVGGVFYNCTALERITLPLKASLIIIDNTFQLCPKLNSVDLVEREILDEIIDALLLEEWKNDMNEEIDSINQVLPNASAGDVVDVGGKAQAIREWITSVLRKLIHYKVEHRRKLNEATAIIQSALPKDIILKNVLPFLELPSYTFEGEE